LYIIYVYRCTLHDFSWIKNYVWKEDFLDFLDEAYLKVKLSLFNTLYVAGHLKVCVIFRYTILLIKELEFEFEVLNKMLVNG
jgi:hypothetical protein